MKSIDLLDEFTASVEEELWDLQISGADPAREAKVRAYLEQLSRKKPAFYRRSKLAYMAGISDRAPNVVMPITAEEANLICSLALSSWDHLLSVACSDDPEKLSKYV